jgi:hypothetical protein
MRDVGGELRELRQQPRAHVGEGIADGDGVDHETAPRANENILYVVEFRWG